MRTLMHPIRAVLAIIAPVTVPAVVALLAISLIAVAHDRVPKDDDDRPVVTCPQPSTWIPCRHTKRGDRCSTHKFFKPVAP